MIPRRSLLSATGLVAVAATACSPDDQPQDPSTPSSESPTPEETTVEPSPTRELAKPDPSLRFPASKGLVVRDGSVIAPSVTHLVTWDATGAVASALSLTDLGADRLQEFSAWAMRDDVLVVSGSSYTWLAVNVATGKTLGRLELPAPEPTGEPPMDAPAPSTVEHAWDLATDGKHVAAALGDGTVVVATVSGEVMAQVSPEQFQPADQGGSQVWVRYSADGRLVMGSPLKSAPVQFWQADGKGIDSVLQGSTPTPQWVLEAPDARVILVASYRQDEPTMPYVVYDSATSGVVFKGALPDIAGAIALSPDGLTVASAGGFGNNDARRRIHLTDLSAGKSVHMERKDYYPESLAYSPDGKTLYSHNSRDGIVEWDPVALTATRAFDLP